MWTTENRPQYDRKGLRYPSDLTDAQWQVMAAHLPADRPGRRGRPRRHWDAAARPGQPRRPRADLR